EGALLGGKPGGGEIGAALQRLQPALGELHRRRRSVAHVAEDERVGEAGDAEADAALGARLMGLLLQREARYVDGVVQHADGDRPPAAGAAPGRAAPPP